MNTAVASLRGQDVSIRRSSTAEEDLRIETSCPLNEATAVFMLKNLCYQEFFISTFNWGAMFLGANCRKNVN